MAPEDTWKKKFDALNRRINRLSATNENLVLHGIKQSSQHSRIHDQNKTQSQTIEKLSRTIEEFRQAIAENDARIAQLEEQKIKNSTNSSKSSSMISSASPGPPPSTGEDHPPQRRRQEAREDTRAPRWNSRKNQIPSSAASLCTVSSACLPRHAVLPSM